MSAKWLIVRMTQAEFLLFIRHLGTKLPVRHDPEKIVDALRKVPGFFSIASRAEGRRILLSTNRKRGERRMQNGEDEE